ncbi:uncharacterized protein LOC111871153 [Cryptotermes secundus]|uniref:uncharacterized protein LOC111871153 n=1 Tax=Cryptotermes secundus TaxID=105785 RepID=UPI000CD7D7EB|nr:uncharacterized protein LOC111871153 [Cryptotermes secundus]
MQQVLLKEYLSCCVYSGTKVLHRRRDRPLGQERSELNSRSKKLQRWCVPASPKRYELASNNRSSSSRDYAFISPSLATASSSGDSSASRLQILPSWTVVQNCLPDISLPFLLS